MPGDGPRLLRTLIIGAGFSGIGMAIRLCQRGERDFLIYERERGIGGTWWVNQYPGCACDIPSRLYSFSFESNPDWSRRFPRQPEIRDYLRRCAQKHGLDAHLRLGTEVVSMRWLESCARWQVVDGQGGVIQARFVVAGTGALSIPAYPQIPGIERFRGRVFHSQRWDHDAPLTGARVAVIGTGASAVQFIPEIQPAVAHLSVFQRTAHWVIPKSDRAFSGAGKWLYRTFSGWRLLQRAMIYLITEARVFGFAFAPRLLSLHRRLSIAMLRRQVRDDDLRQRLTPRFAIGCKRILLSDDYFSAVARPNVELVTETILKIDEDAVITADGHRHPIDVLVFATGFKASEPFPRGMVRGRDGRDLTDAWANGPEAYKGTTTTGFPNLFLLMGPNTGLGHNSIVYMIESQIAYVLAAIDAAERRGATVIEVRAQAQRAFNERLQRRFQGTVWADNLCSSWYQHRQSGRNVVIWPGSSWSFRRATRRFDADAYDLSTAST